MAETAQSGHSALNSEEPESTRYGHPQRAAVDKIVIATGLILLSYFMAPGQVCSQELLEMVDPAHVQALEEYNAAWLEDQTYFAARHRIVKVNAYALFQRQDVFITPFGDMQPIELIFDSLDRDTRWKGYYQNDPIYAATGQRVLLVRFSMFAYTVDDAGNAVNTAQERADFFSVSAVLDVPGGSKFVLTPLKFTPRYSVIYEIRRDTVIPFRIDVLPGDPPLSDEEQAVLDEYKDFRKQLPDEANKKVVGDVW